MANVAKQPLNTLASLLVVAALLAAPPLAAQRGRFEETTTVTVVEVPVQVLRDGRPVRNLTRGDFEILDNRKPQEIIGFDVVDLTVSEKTHGGIPIAGRRHFLALFDLSFSQLDSITRAREAAAKLVLEGLHPTDLVAVATYTRARGPNLVLGFTADRNQIRQAIATLGLATPAERIVDPLGLVVGDLSAAIDAPLPPVSDAGGRVGDLVAENTRDLKTLQGRVNRDQQKNQVLALTSSLEAIAQMMNVVQGRKHVLFLSEGFDSSVLVGLQSTTQEGQQRMEEINRAVQDGQTWLVDDEERFGNAQAQSALTRMLEEFKRADCTIEAIDIGGLVAGGVNTRQESLLSLAKDTGGGLYSNTNDLSEAMEEMLDRTSVTYLLAFQPKGLENDDKYHRLKVRLKGGDSGVELVHRPGYYPPKPYQMQSPMERRLESAQQLLGGDGGAIGTSVLAAAFDIPGEKAYVPVMVEIAGEDLIRNLEQDRTSFEIYAYALDAGGTVRDFFVRKLGLDLRQARAALEQTGFKYWGHFDLEPGEYWAKVLVRNDDSGLAGSSSGPFEVPSRGDQEGLLLPPFFPEPFDRWIWGREEEGERRAGAPHPFQYGEEPFFPSARPLLEPGREVPVSLMGYNLGRGDLDADCQLIDDAGELVPNGGRLSLVDAAAADAGLSRLSATFKPGRLERGEYVLQVRVVNRSSGREQTSSIPVLVL